MDNYRLTDAVSFAVREQRYKQVQNTAPTSRARQLKKLTKSAANNEKI